MDGHSIIVNTIFGLTAIWLLFQMIKRLAAAEEELMDARFELRAARRNVETLDMIVKMQREQLAAMAAAATESTEELEEGEIRSTGEAQMRRRD